MSALLIIVICLSLILLVGVGYFFTRIGSTDSVDKLHVLSARGVSPMHQASATRSPQASEKSLNAAKAKEKEASIDPKNKNVMYFQAGIFSEAEKQDFEKQLKLILLIGTPLLVGLTSYLFGLMGAGVGTVMGILAVRIYPDIRLNKKIVARQDECSYYLPLVVEQLAIGVSSGLDIGPCIAYVVEMANERGSHSVVTELLGHVMKLTKTGMSLEEGLLEIGSICGYAPARNAFSFLAQCSKHGGEITKQLMELSESVTLERQAIIETKVNALPNKATGVLGLIFGGFFVMIVSAIFIKIYLSFK